jgi:hypothetical protein
MSQFTEVRSHEEILFMVGMQHTLDLHELEANYTITVGDGFAERRCISVWYLVSVVTSLFVSG